MEEFIVILPLIVAWAMDLLWGDPAHLPHPVVGFGKLIARGEQRLNRGNRRRLKGACLALGLVMLVFFATKGLLSAIGSVSVALHFILSALCIFYCLAGTTLIREVREVFRAVDRSLEEGRRQVGRIVGRDTSELSAQEVRTAALETLAENLSDGVIAPLFWLALLGVPGMMAYKMINTLDSMIGYRNERYAEFGCWAARMDDVANFLPARLTAFLMIMASGRPSLLRFVRTFGPQHASPNSGYPEAALAGILDCRFGGPHNYFGKEVRKPFIGTHSRTLTTQDMQLAVRINRLAEVLMMLLTTLLMLIFNC